jgi:hypothetical protein
VIIVLLDSVNTSQSDLNPSNEALLISDYELNGTVNRAASEGAKFALVLAMLEQDCTHRPQVEKQTENRSSLEVENNLNFYRSNPLIADDSYWHTCQKTSQFIAARQIQTAHLWLAMHPEPLSQHNKSDIIDDAVIANCGVNVQNRLKQAEQVSLKVDETGLYDILQQLEPAVA